MSFLWVVTCSDVCFFFLPLNRPIGVSNLAAQEDGQAVPLLGWIFDFVGFERLFQREINCLPISDDSVIFFTFFYETVHTSFSLKFMHAACTLLSVEQS